ncbi:methionyl-tRNA formyltransferase [Thermodesulfobacteriota bacterium]
MNKLKFPQKPKLVYMGTPDFAVPALEALIHNRYDILAVVTQPDRPKGRGRKLSAPPVKSLAQKNSIEVLQPEKVSSQKFYNLLREKAPDLIIVVAFGQILNKPLLDIPEWGVINIHASLLPKYRGAAPIQRAVLNNESVTGLTIMHMDERLDQGHILFQEEVPISANETSGSLHDRLSSISGDLLINFLRSVAGKSIEGIPQENSQTTYAHKIDRDMAKIDWTQDAVAISCLIRALDPWPGAYTKFDNKDVKLFSPTVINDSFSDATPGKVVNCSKNGLCIETGKGAISVKEILYPGKKRLHYSDFIRGFNLPEGTILGE